MQRIDLKFNSYFECDSKMPENKNDSDLNNFSEEGLDVRAEVPCERMCSSENIISQGRSSIEQKFKKMCHLRCSFFRIYCACILRESFRGTF